MPLIMLFIIAAIFYFHAIIVSLIVLCICAAVFLLVIIPMGWLRDMARPRRPCVRMMILIKVVIITINNDTYNIHNNNQNNHQNP